jgi:hypothetical protein
VHNNNNNKTTYVIVGGKERVRFAIATLLSEGTGWMKDILFRVHHGMTCAKNSFPVVWLTVRSKILTVSILLDFFLRYPKRSFAKSSRLAVEARWLVFGYQRKTSSQ